MMSRAILLFCALCSAAASALADPPTPVSSPLFAFPSVHPGPASARSAGLALADRWLGEEPFDNPAGSGARIVSVSAAVLRMDRQDLAADGLHFDEETAFFKVGGGCVSTTTGRLGLALYAYHPVMRFENNAFEKGERGGPTPPAIIQSSSSARELLAGLATSYPLGRVRLGLAGEWIRREDDYFYNEESGAPGEGTRQASFKGSAVGSQVGAHMALHAGGSERLVVGAALRYVPALDLDGTQDLAILADTSRSEFKVTRASGWEGGLSARYSVSEEFHLLAGAGGATARDWRGFGITSGRSGLWSIGAEFHDRRDPWTARLGIGRESQVGAQESRAGMFGLGFGYRSGDLIVDLGFLRRTLTRADHPTSFDDRLIGTTTYSF